MNKYNAVKTAARKYLGVTRKVGVILLPGKSAPRLVVGPVSVAGGALVFDAPSNVTRVAVGIEWSAK